MAALPHMDSKGSWRLYCVIFQPQDVGFAGAAHRHHAEVVVIPSDRAASLIPTQRIDDFFHGPGMTYY
jgi:hypothetical protein